MFFWAGCACSSISLGSKTPKFLSRLASLASNFVFFWLRWLPKNAKFSFGLATLAVRFHRLKNAQIFFSTRFARLASNFVFFWLRWLPKNAKFSFARSSISLGSKMPKSFSWLASLASNFVFFGLRWLPKNAKCSFGLAALAARFL